MDMKKIKQVFCCLLVFSILLNVASYFLESIYLKFGSLGFLSLSYVCMLYYLYRAWRATGSFKEMMKFHSFMVGISVLMLVIIICRLIEGMCYLNV